MKKVLIILFTVFLAAGSSAGAAPAAKPMAEILNSSIHLVGLTGSYKVQGNVVNKTNDTIQVTLRVVVYDKARNILTSSLVPTDPVFIYKGQTARFRVFFSHDQTKIRYFTVEIVDTVKMQANW